MEVKITGANKNDSKETLETKATLLWDRGGGIGCLYSHFSHALRQRAFQAAWPPLSRLTFCRAFLRGESSRSFCFSGKDYNCRCEIVGELLRRVLRPSVLLLTGRVRVFKGSACTLREKIFHGGQGVGTRSDGAQDRIRRTRECMNDHKAAVLSSDCEQWRTTT